jgi:hypothetical protein
LGHGARKKNKEEYAEAQLIFGNRVYGVQGRLFNPENTGIGIRKPENMFFNEIWWLQLEVPCRHLVI